MGKTTRAKSTSGKSAMESFLDTYGESAAEAIWRGALTMIEEAARAAAEGRWGRWRQVPRDELRRLRRDLAAALAVAHAAVAIQAEQNERDEEIIAPLRRAAERAAAKARRQGTLEAERVRLLKAGARRTGEPLTRRELDPWLWPDDDERGDEPAWWPDV